ncbi:xanthine dehydrogenase accessory protein XdhC [Brevirhabdus sp.]|uniref:xanthine dehydrogenase accessory protein XdhC n=1 Tax=Brevirhabdus sp. TaxID=2004514 RepID=UPI00405A0582
MLDLAALRRAVEEHDRVVRVVIADHRGSAPRHAGAAMLVWRDGQSGTIGGGRLEHEALRRARLQLAQQRPVETRAQPLGPALGQCCGGAVTVVSECFDRARLAQLGEHGAFLRPITPAAEHAGAPPKSLQRLLRTRHLPPVTLPPVTLARGWLLEPLFRPARHVMIYGAGHVGRALATLLVPLEDFDVTLTDARADLLADLPDRLILRADVHSALDAAPDTTEHFVMTHDHQLDLDLCHRLLARPAASVGLIGSQTKRARFRRRLQQLGHSLHTIDRLKCPIGLPELGNQPQAIAIGVAHTLLAQPPITALRKEAAE